MQVPFPQMRHFLDQQVLPMLHRMMPYDDLGPRIEVRQQADSILVIAELPGLKNQNDLDIHALETTLTISGTIERDESHHDEDVSLFHTERAYGKFSRTIPLPVPIDTEHVQASYRNGLLTVKMKKNTGLQGRRVDVEFLQ